MNRHTSFEEAKSFSVLKNERVRQTQRARDEERRHIARELHDDVGQSMASLKLNLKWVEDIIRAGGNMEEAASELTSARDLAGAVLNKIRDLSHTLYPPLLDTLGLPSAIKEMAYQATRHSALEAVCSIRGQESPLSKELGVALYRCCQEAVNNAVCHSGASKINIEIVYGVSGIHLAVADNGHGFDTKTHCDSGKKTMSAGFWTMRQRMNDLGGSFRVSSAGEGTMVEIAVPFEEA